MPANTRALAPQPAAPKAPPAKHPLLLSFYEGVELALFMLSACAFTVLLFHPASPALAAIPSPTLRRALMGITMGITAVLIIHSPMGKRSGAHFNPAITLTFLRLGKIDRIDALFYIAAQFAGGVLGVALAALLFGRALASPAVDYVVTVPGIFGTAGAFLAELFMAALLMYVVLHTSTRPALAPYTSYLVGVLISLYVLFLAPVSGFSINPARTAGSAVFAHLWTSVWVYFTAPLLGMFFSAELYLRLSGTHPVAELAHPQTTSATRLHSHYFTHRHLTAKPTSASFTPPHTPP